MNICSQINHVHIVTLLDDFSFVDAMFSANGKNTAHSDQTTNAVNKTNKRTWISYHDITVVPCYALIAIMQYLMVFRF